MSAGRIWSIVIVALLHAIIGYAFVSGLAMRVIEKTREDLKTFDVEEPPPPEEEPPPPPPDQPTQPPPISAPPVLNRVQQQPTMSAPPPPPVAPMNFAPPAPPAPVAPPPPPPPPPPPRQAARPAQHRSGTITNDDYPAAAIRAEAQGTTTIRMSVGADGRVSGCTVTRSSGNSSLDSTACNLATRRFRFTPAQDENGNNVAGSATRSIRWQLPEN